MGKPNTTRGQGLSFHCNPCQIGPPCDFRTGAVIVTHEPAVPLTRAFPEDRNQFHITLARIIMFECRLVVLESENGFLLTDNQNLRCEITHLEHPRQCGKVGRVRPAPRSHQMARGHIPSFPLCL